MDKFKRNTSGEKFLSSGLINIDKSPITYLDLFLSRLVLRERFLGRLLITTGGSLLVYF
jgi:hypothetical protein